jgi:predicted DNA-binding transcriptional regulator AlpA
MTNKNESTFISSREIYTSPRYPITKAVLFRKINDGSFPTPMRVTNAFHWLKADVDLFFELNA